MGKLKIPMFQTFARQTPKQGSKNPVGYLYLGISLGMIGCIKQKFSA